MNNCAILALIGVMLSYYSECRGQFVITPKVGLYTSFVVDNSQACQVLDKSPDYLYPNVRLSFSHRLSNKFQIGIDGGIISGKVDGNGFNNCATDSGLINFSYKLLQISPNIKYDLSNLLTVGFGVSRNFILESYSNQVTIGGPTEFDVKDMSDRSYLNGFSIEIIITTFSDKVTTSLRYDKVFNNLGVFDFGNINFFGIEIGYNINFSD